MCRDPLEPKFEGDIGIHADHPRGEIPRRMPAEGGIKILEQAAARHVGLAAAALFGRTSVKTECAGELLLFHIVPYSNRGGSRTSAEQIVPAAMTGTAFDDWSADGAFGDLTEIGKCVVFTHDADYRRTGAIFGNERSCHAGNMRRNAKALFFQQRRKECTGIVLVEGEFGMIPDITSGLNKNITVCLDVLYDPIGWFHCIAGSFL